MKYNEFCEKLKLTLASLFKGEYQVKLINVDKLNGVILKGLTVTNKKQNISPTIYLESFYNKYNLGSTIHDIANEIYYDYLQKYVSGDNLFPFPSLNFTDYTTVQNKIYFRLINYQMNQQYLKNIPHKRWLDLAIVFNILVNNQQTEISSITITHTLLENWQLTVDDIMKIANYNTPILFSPSSKSLYETIYNILLEDNVDPSLINLMGSNENCPMYVASNTKGIHGASWLLYPNELKKLSTILDSNLYILPSSIHEVIVIPATKELSKSELLNMVKEINQSQVPINEVLSNNVYYYDSQIDQLQSLF